jgi:hypothetical protein
MPKRAEESCRKIIENIQDLFQECRDPDQFFLYVEYQARRYSGDVSYAASATRWQKRPMRKLEGTTNKFFAFSILEPCFYEYKYLEDGAWEPYNNREIQISNHQAIIKKFEENRFIL